MTSPRQYLRSRKLRKRIAEYTPALVVPITTNGRIVGYRSVPVQS